MKKIFLILFVLPLLLVPINIAAQGKGIVQCDICTLSDLLGLPGVIISWLLNIVTALAIFFITVGGILLLISGGNPELKNLGKKTLLAAVIGLALALGARAIINFILDTLSATGGRL